MRMLAVLVLTGCGLTKPSLMVSETPDASEGHGSGDAHTADAMADAIMIDAPPNCFGTGLVQVCLQSMPSGAINYSGSTPLNTDNFPACAAVMSGPPACVVAAQTIVLSGAVQVTGSRPLVIVATSSITVGGTLDVASHGNGSVGAGANPSTCNPGTGPATSNGAGAGGSFGSFGGHGAAGSNGAPGGAAGMPVALVTLRGGCAGQLGAAGGGAVFLIAPVISLNASAVINASGSGGRPGYSGRGGGGGGSGGLIGFDTPSLQAAPGARLLANGGGGGEGGGTGNGAAGADPSGTNPAAGGSADPDGGDGGSGGAFTSSGGAGATGTNGGEGGGGGGGIGYIYVHPMQSLAGVSVSPPPTY